MTDIVSPATLATVILPSRHELNASFVAASYQVASVPAQIGTLATTRPLVASIMTMTWPAPTNRRWLTLSRAMPVGSAPGATDQLGGHLLRRHVDHIDLVLVLDVDEDLAGAVGLPGLGRSRQWNRRHDTPGRRVDLRGGHARVIEDPHFVLPRIEGDRIWIRAAGVDLAQRRERLRIDDADLVLAAVAREDATSAHSDAVHARRVRNAADHLVGRGIDDDDLGAVRHVQPPAGGVRQRVVPLRRTWPADLDVRDLNIRSLRGHVPDGQTDNRQHDDDAMSHEYPRAFQHGDLKKG